MRFIPSDACICVQHVMRFIPSDTLICVQYVMRFIPSDTLICVQYVMRFIPSDTLICVLYVMRFTVICGGCRELLCCRARKYCCIFLLRLKNLQDMLDFCISCSIRFKKIQTIKSDCEKWSQEKVVLLLLYFYREILYIIWKRDVCSFYLFTQLRRRASSDIIKV